MCAEGAENRHSISTCKRKGLTVSDEQKHLKLSVTAIRLLSLNDTLYECYSKSVQTHAN